MTCSSRPRSIRRRGVATLWIIIAVFLAFTMLCFAAETGNLWLARVQLQTSLESAALAAVDSWGDAGGGPGTQIHRDRGVDLAKANLVCGIPVSILDNFSMGGQNGNDSSDGNLVFGGITGVSPVTFDHQAVSGCHAGQRRPAVLARGTVEVPTLCSRLIGIGSFNISASTYAVYNCGAGEPALIRVEISNCP